MKLLLLLCLWLCGCVSGWTQHRYGVEDGLPSNQSRQVICLPDGRLVVQTDGALSVFDGARFRPITLDRRLRQPIESFFGIDHYLDAEERLWVKDNSSLYVLDAPTLRLLDAKELLAGVGKAKVKNVFVTPDAVVWVHAWDDRLYRCHDGDTTAVMTIDNRNAEGINAAVCDVVQVGRRTVVLLSDGTLTVLGEKPRQVAPPSLGYRLCGEAIDSTRIALRTHDGVFVYDLTKADGGEQPYRVRYSVFQLTTAAQGIVTARAEQIYLLTPDSVRLLQSVQGLTPLQGATLDSFGGLWACTWGDGLLYYSPYPAVGHWQPSTSDPLLNSEHHDSRGRVWRTYRDARITVDDTVYDATNTPFLRGSIPFCIEVEDGAYLSCIRMNRLGVFRMDSIDMITDASPELLHYRNVVDACRVGQRIVVGTQNGIYSFDCNTRRADADYFAEWNANQWSDKVNCLLPQGDSVVWIGTPSGLFRMKDKQSERVSAENVQSLVFDACGRLWMSTIDGRIVQGDRTVVKCNATFRERKARLLPDGQLEFLAGDSAFVFHPDSVRIPQLRLIPHIVESVASEATYDASALVADVSALAYGLENQVVYRYRLHGADDDWHVVERSNGHLRITYNVVPPGKYVLQVQAALQGQPWGEMLELPYRVTPPWWQTWWAYTLYIIVVLAILGTIAGLIFRHRQELLKQRYREKALLRQIETLIKVAPPIALPQPSPTGEGVPKPMGEEKEQTDGEHQSPSPVGEGRGGAFLSPDDAAFVQHAITLVHQHLHGNYTVEQLASDLCMERTGLYKRLTALINQSPQIFIRSIRLNHAKELMHKGESITNAAYEVGFNSVSYFDRCFNKEFGCSPSEYLKKIHPDA